MLYLLDANVLIDANRDYYPIARVPEFWEWLTHVGRGNLVKIPLEVFEEIKAYDDDLAEWAKTPDVEAALLFAGDVRVTLVSQVINEGYAPDLNDIEVEKIGRDPFLCAHGLADLGQRCVVTTEVSKPSTRRSNRKLPDVCNQFGVPWCNTFKLLRGLDFSTGWKSP